MFRVTIDASDGASGSTLSETRDLAPGDSLTFGREPGPGGVTLPGQGVSRRHFELVADAQGLTVTDLDSTNGTQLAGVALGSARITTGQRISAADTTVTVGYEEVEAKAAPVGTQSRYITPAAPEDTAGPRYSAAQRAGEKGGFTCATAGTTGSAALVWGGVLLLAARRTRRG